MLVLQNTVVFYNSELYPSPGQKTSGVVYQTMIGTGNGKTSYILSPPTDQKLAARGKPSSVKSKVVTSEQMGISWLRSRVSG